MIFKDTAKSIYKSIRSSLRDVYWDAQGLRIPIPSGVQLTGTILFLCKGNICRSPFAEVYAQQFCKTEDVTFLSAGIEVSKSNAPPQTAIEAARSFDVRLENHHSRPLTIQMMKQADAVFVMEVAQLTRLKKDYPTETGKIFPLALFQASGAVSPKGYEKYNIADPYGRTLDTFIRCYQRIIHCIETIPTSGKQIG